ncbi:MAG TPA: DUF5916 domain-containing protein [Bryobacteraceae bacterium]|nr:DUF5916 domain-containing protein [Bryobacteraceae bacterium]
MSRETIGWIAWDDNNFYAAFLCKAEPGLTRARMARREDIFSDDEVALYLDTFHDRQHVFSFYVNPFGIQADSINTEGGTDDYSFDTIWKSEGRLTPDGYAVLMAIPFRSLRFPNTAQQEWGVGLARFIPSQSESSYWPLYTNRIEGFATQLATMDGLENISPGRNLQFIPYTTLDSTHFLDQPETGVPSYRQIDQMRGGLDAKAVIHDAFTLDVTLNPDFSQVETEDPKVTVDQRFEVFFPEKRPFFLDNASYFQTPENLFFSRRIVNPKYGARLTGKAGKWLVGLLAINDRTPALIDYPSSQLEIEPVLGNSVIGVARVQRTFFNQSTAGIFFSDYNSGGNTERTYSFDTRLRLTPNLVLTGQAVRTEERYTDGTHPHGQLFHVDLNYTGLHLTTQSTFRDLGPGFFSTLSYIPRVNIRQGLHTLTYKWLPAGRIVKTFGPTVNITEDWDHSGTLEDWIVQPGIISELTGNTTFTLQRSESVEVFDNIHFRKHSTDVSLVSEISRIVGVNIQYGEGAGVNYYPATGVLPFLASAKNLTAGLTFRPSRKIKLDEMYLFSHLSTLEKSIVAAMYGPGAVYGNHLWRSNLNYQFTRELSLRAIIDYNGVLPNTSLIDYTLGKTVTANFLLTWLLNPGTALYVGYTDTHQNLALFAGQPNYVGIITPPTTTTGREIFVKLSYLIRR